jgi:2-methylcitrate dehydratase
MDQTLQTLAEFASSLKYDQLRKQTVHEAKRRIVDTFGCSVGAYHMEPPRIARHYAMQVTANPGSTIFGTRHRTTPELAALANGIMARYLDYNDTAHTRDAGHPSDMIPAMFSVAEYVGATGEQVIAGTVVAYEVMDRLSQVMGLTQIGFDYITYVAIGSAAGAANILGLSKEQTANAIALATTSYIGLLQNRVGVLSMWKGSAPGNASRNGVFCALIARLGMTGPVEAFEGKAGFLKMVTEAHGPTQMQPFGDQDHPFMVEISKFKFYPTDYECQTAANPAVELHQLLKGRIPEIEKVVIYGYKFGIDVATGPEKWDPRTRETADHSLPYVVATALIKGDVFLDDFEEKSFRDPERLALMKKIEAHEDPQYTRDYPEAYRFRIEVTLKSGEKLVRDVRYGKGHPKNTLTDAEINLKFRKLVKDILLPAQTDKALQTLWVLETVKNLSDIYSLFEL